MAFLAGRSALVTGAAGGIGAEVVDRLLAEGAAVVAFDVRPAEPRQTWPAGRVQAVAGNVSSAEDVNAAVRAAEAWGGPLAALVTCAGVYSYARITELSDEQWRATVDVNLKGTFVCCRAAGRAMLRHGAGAIVTMSSSLGYAGATGRAHYAATKAGVSAFTKALAQELGPSGVRVNAVAPGSLDTAMPRSMPGRTEEDVQRTLLDNPLRHKGTPADAADLIMFLLSPAGSHITGQVIHINAGSLMW